MRHPAAFSLLLSALVSSAAMSAVLFSSSSALAQQPSDEGARLFQAGRTAFDAREFPRALEAFRRSLDLLPSPNTQLFIARCLREMNRNAEAWRQFQAAVAQAQERIQRGETRYQPTLQSATQESNALTSRIGMLVLQVSNNREGVIVRVNGRPTGPQQWNRPLAYDPGAMLVEMLVPGGAVVQQNIELHPGETRGVPLDVNSALAPNVVLPGNPVANQPPPTGVPNGPPLPVMPPSTGTPPPPPPRSPVGPALLITGGVVTGAALITGLVSWMTYNSLESDCRPVNGQCTVRPMDAAGRAALGQATGTTFTIGLIAGGGLLIAGGVVFAMSAPPPPPQQPLLQGRNSAVPTLSFVPSFDPSFAGVSALGRF